MVTPASRRLLLPTRAALALLLVAGGALAGCDNRPFSRDDTASNATKLAVPSTLTPPIRVGRVDGAPDDWHMRRKVAAALQQRDIPAGTGPQGDSAYLLRGKVRETSRTRLSSQVNVVWTLYDPKGKKVGEVTQVAAVPAAAMRKANNGVVDAIADAAAESISPIVPSTRIDVADNITTGEPDDKAKKSAAKNRVTALGRQKKSDSGIARNLAALVNPKAKKDGTKLSLPRPLTADDANARNRRKRAATALGRLDDDDSVLARNLNKGINPGAGDAKTRGRKTPAAVDDRPPDLADPNRRAPKVAFRQRPKPRLLHQRATPKQVAETPPPGTSRTKTSAATATPSKRPEPPVVTEFYPTAPKKSRRHAAAPAAKRRPPRTIASATTVPIPRAALRNPAPKAKPEAEPAPVQQAATHKPATHKPAGRKLAARKPAPKQVATAPDRPAAHGKLVFWVQVGSYRTAKLSAAKWTETKTQAPSLLGDVPHRIARARVGDRGIWHRIQVGPYASKGRALRLCRQLKAVRLDCFILPERAGPGVSPVSLAPRAAPRVTVVTDDVRPRAAAPTPVRKPPRPVVRHWPSTRHGFPLTTAPGLPGLIP